MIPERVEHFIDETPKSKNPDTDYFHKWQPIERVFDRLRVVVIPGKMRISIRLSSWCLLSNFSEQVKARAKEDGIKLHPFRCDQKDGKYSLIFARDIGKRHVQWMYVRATISDCSARYSPSFHVWDVKETRKIEQEAIAEQ